MTRLPTLAPPVSRMLLVKVPVATVTTGIPFWSLVRVWTVVAVLQLPTTGTRTLTKTRLHYPLGVLTIPLIVTPLPLVSLTAMFATFTTLAVTLWPSLPLLIRRTCPFVQPLPVKLLRQPWVPLLPPLDANRCRAVARWEWNSGPVTNVPMFVVSVLLLTLSKLKEARTTTAILLFICLWTPSVAVTLLTLGTP